MLSETEGMELLRRIAKGEDAALDEFYRHYSDCIYRYAMSRLNETHTAADILTEVMVEVWQRGARFEGRSRITTWLLGIAHNKVVDMFRKQQRRNSLAKELEMAEEECAEDPESLQALVSDANYLQRALAKLDEIHREILHLVFFEDLNYTEIASVLQIREGTVKSRLHYAKSKLKQLLGEEITG